MRVLQVILMLLLTTHLSVSEARTSVNHKASKHTLVKHTAYVSTPRHKSTRVTTNHKPTVVAAAKRLKVDHRTMLTTAKLESGFDAKARNKHSSAGGLFQFTDRTWKAMLRKHGRAYGYALNTPKTNPRANALMAAHYQADNQDALEEVLGRSPTPGELYMAHLLGEGGATKILTAKRTAKASRLLPQAAAGNRKYFYTDNGRSRTVSQFCNYLNWVVNTERSKV